jgi:mannose-6-phosphate isomerase-like protein (cupin superfamily)
MILSNKRSDQNIIKNLTDNKKKIIFKKKPINFFQNKIIKKPWGFEYCVKSSKKFALWVLCLKKKQCTSMHAHLTKKTYLINTKKINFVGINKEHKINPFSILEIEKGSFHQTKNSSNEDTVIFEIETPNNKFDLLRYKDKYNRNSSNYENKTLKNKGIFSLKKKIRKDYLNFIEGKKVKLNQKILKNDILILIDGQLILDKKKLDYFKPLKIKKDICLLKNKNFNNKTNFFIVKNNI